MRTRTIITAVVLAFITINAQYDEYVTEERCLYFNSQNFGNHTNTPTGSARADSITVYKEPTVSNRIISPELLREGQIMEEMIPHYVDINDSSSLRGTVERTAEEKIASRDRMGNSAPKPTSMSADVIKQITSAATTKNPVEISIGQTD